MKSTNQTKKKPRTRKSSNSDNTASDAYSERQENVKQTAQENSIPGKTAREEKNEVLKEVRNCGKREGSGKISTSGKIQRKSTRVKAATRDKETVNVPFSTNKRAWTQSGSDTANESIHKDIEQNYENESLKTNRKKCNNDAVRKNKSKSPPRENATNKKEEGVVPLEAGGKKSSQYARNNYNPTRQQERNSRNQSSDIHRHDFSVSSRSPIHFDSEKNDLHNKPQTDKARYKRSPKTNILKHRSNSRSRQISAMENESQEFQLEDKRSSFVTNEDYSQVSSSKDSGKDPPQKQNSVQISTKPNLLGSAPENSRTHQNDSSSVKSKKIGVMSLELRSQTPNFLENSSKVSKRSKTERWMKRQRNGKEVVSEREQNGRDTVAKYEGKNRKKTKKKLLKSTTRKK